jgi:hypothetical protein
MNVGDMVRFKSLSRLDFYAHMNEIGIVMGWDRSHPVVFFPSLTGTFVINALEVVN